MTAPSPVTMQLPQRSAGISVFIYFVVLDHSTKKKVSKNIALASFGEK